MKLEDARKTELGTLTDAEGVLCLVEERVSPSDPRSMIVQGKRMDTDAKCSTAYSIGASAGVRETAIDAVWRATLDGPKIRAANKASR